MFPFQQQQEQEEEEGGVGGKSEARVLTERTLEEGSMSGGSFELRWSVGGGPLRWKWGPLLIDQGG